MHVNPGGIVAPSEVMGRDALSRAAMEATTKTEAYSFFRTSHR